MESNKRGVSSGDIHGDSLVSERVERLREDETQRISEAVAPAADQNTPATKEKVRKSSKTLIIILSSLLGLVVVLFTILLFVFVLPNNKNGDGANLGGSTNVNNPDDLENVETHPPELPEEITKIGNYHVVKWMNEAYVPAKAFLVNHDGEDTTYTGKYTKSAELTDGAVLVRYDQYYDSGAYDGAVWFVVDGAKVTMVGSSFWEFSEDYLASFVKYDPYIITELVPTDDRSYNKLTFTSAGSYYSNTKISEYEKNGVSLIAGDFYEAKWNVSASSDGSVNARQFFVKTPDDFVHIYNAPTILNNDSTLNIKWNDEANRTLTFQRPLRGCSIKTLSVDATLKDEPDVDALVQVGVTKDGLAVYRLAEGDFVKELYDEYISWGYNEMSFEEYKTKLTHVVYKDGLGDWVLLYSTEYNGAGECGKPVIYLYPEVETNVSVKVGADVRISDPFYPLSGWQNVLAKPSGELTYNGEKYDSLFWEGLGHGGYPSVDGIGTVVSQKNLLPTVRKQLRQQGLNPKEIADFMVFWSENLPETPYVKLTWLTTEQMNELAPLSVSPRPQTVIRVFLDAQGLQKPVDLQPQTLVAPERKGFTLVEWGGLLQR